ncbi:MAG: disulfide bond formation protein B [Chromatiaceae bacterium]
MKIRRDRKIWLFLTTGSAAPALASMVMTHWLGLQPCHWCIFQRLIFMLTRV